MIRKKKVEKPFNGGKWSAARKRSFIISQLRRSRWPPKYAAIARAYVGPGINPKTGNKCKLHKCEACGKLFPKGEMRGDHRVPIVSPNVGFVDWNTWIERWAVEEQAYDVICVTCHALKTKSERAIRTERKRKEKKEGE